MTHFQIESIPLNEINSVFPYRVRYRLEDSKLEESVRAEGILEPLVLDRKKHILAGHKRYVIAQEQGIQHLPCRIFEKELDHTDGYLTALLLNWNQVWTELDCVYAVRKAAKDFRLSADQIKTDILPLLGLAREEPVLEEYLSAGALNPAILHQVDAGKVPFRGIYRFNFFEADEQLYFAEKIFETCALTSNQLKLTGEWLLDLKRKTRKKVMEILEAENAFGFLKEANPDRKQKGEKFFAVLRAMRFPRLVDQEKLFQSAIEPLKQAEKRISIEPMPYFEDEGYTLRIRVRRREDIQEVLRKLDENRGLLNSLFDIML